MTKDLKNKKIAFFIPALRGGGAEKVFVNIINYLKRDGFDVTLIVMEKEGPYLQVLHENIPAEEIGSFEPLALIRLVLLLNKKEYDTIISALPASNLLNCMAKIISKRFVSIITEHAFFSVYSHITRRIKTRIRVFLMRLCYSKADKAIAVSRGAAEDLASQTGLRMENIEVIYNPLDLNDIEKKSKQQPDHSWLKKKTSPVLVSVCRLEPPKDFDTLFDAMTQIPDCRLIVLGEGYLEERLRRQVQNMNLQDRIDFSGFVENPYAYMAASDGLILSSDFEGFGYVLVEAMAVGTSVVSTNCPGGPAEILDNGKYGHLTRPRDANSLAHAIEKTLDTPHDRELLRARAQEFSIDKIIEQYITVIEKTLEKSKKQ
jgi:glycosyltransferase involved in cell wall biosynthesis